MNRVSVDILGLDGDYKIAFYQAREQTAAAGIPGTPGQLTEPACWSLIASHYEAHEMVSAVCWRTRPP